jgi:hypothetical protein
VITALEAEAWARLDRHLHEKYDPTALGGRADIHYNLNVEPNSPWVNLQADIFYAEVDGHFPKSHDTNTFSIWRATGDVYEVQHHEVIDENGPLIPWKAHQANIGG